MLIAIDHGNKQIKTVHAMPFTSGLIQSDALGFGTDYLAYQGKYYALTDQRIPYRRDKTEDERFFILTLFAIAYEIEATEQYSDNLMRVQLAVGLPPAHFGVQAKRFTVYFEGRGAISFQFHGKAYAIFIESATCFPQSFSAAAATIKGLASIPKVLVVDIGGFTADYVCLRNGVPDMAACDSMESGVILIGIPCEPAAAHPVPGRQRIDLRCAFSHHFITVLIHVLRLDDLLRPVSVQERKQFIQLGGVVGAQRGNECPVHQRVSDIRLEAAFRHIYHAGAGIAHKMNGAPRGRSHALSRGGQRQVFHARFLRRIVFILERVIQPDLRAVDQTVYTEDGNDDA